jgi:hypothetical protein
VEHVAEGQENNRGTPQGCSPGGDGAIKYFNISELGDRDGCQKTFTPSSLRYEDQVEVRLPLSMFRVENFEVEMQENRDRSTVYFALKAREASREDTDASAEPGSRAYTPDLPDPTDRYGDGRT